MYLRKLNSLDFDRHYEIFNKWQIHLLILNELNHFAANERSSCVVYRCYDLWEIITFFYLPISSYAYSPEKGLEPQIQTCVSWLGPALLHRLPRHIARFPLTESV